MRADHICPSCLGGACPIRSVGADPCVRPSCCAADHHFALPCCAARPSLCSVGAYPCVRPSCRSFANDTSLCRGGPVCPPAQLCGANVASLCRGGAMPRPRVPRSCCRKGTNGSASCRFSCLGLRPRPAPLGPEDRGTPHRSPGVLWTPLPPSRAGAAAPDPGDGDALHWY